MAKEQADLSVGAFIDQVWGLVENFFEPLAALGWSLGDWTFFMPILFAAGYWAFERANQKVNGGCGAYAAAMIAGLIIGGVFEHYQTSLEECLPDGPRACIEGE